MKLPVKQFEGTVKTQKGFEYEILQQIADVENKLNFMWSISTTIIVRR
jgi:hypothetical protein